MRIPAVWLVGLTIVLAPAGCFRTIYPKALLMSQQQCAEVYKACAEAARAGRPCPRYPRCPMTAQWDVHVSERFRDLGMGVPWQEQTTQE